MKNIIRKGSLIMSLGFYSANKDLSLKKKITLYFSSIQFHEYYTVLGIHIQVIKPIPGKPEEGVYHRLPYPEEVHCQVGRPFAA